MITVAGEALIDLIVDPAGHIDPRFGGGPFNVVRAVGSPYLTGVPPIRPLRPGHPDPAGRTYGALAGAPLLATVRDPLRRGSFLACRAARVVAMRTRRAWLRGLANPRAFLATSFAVRLCASAFAFE